VEPFGNFVRRTEQGIRRQHLTAYLHMCRASEPCLALQVASWPCMQCLLMHTLLVLHRLAGFSLGIACLYVCGCRTAPTKCVACLGSATRGPLTSRLNGSSSLATCQPVFVLRASRSADGSLNLLLQVDALDSDDGASAPQHPEDHAHSSHHAATINGAGDMSHSQLPASTAAPLLRRAGRLDPNSQDGSDSSPASTAAVSMAAAETQQQDEVAAGAGLVHGGSGGGSSSGSGRRSRPGHHQGLTELQAQVGYLLINTVGAQHLAGHHMITLVHLFIFCAKRTNS
jgi:hypothetical protein